MALQSRDRGIIGKATNGKYVVQFRRHCHQLVLFGYARLHDERHADSDEDFITQRIVEEIRSAQRERLLPKWAYRYSAHDQVPVSLAGRRGKRRPKIDIEVESTSPHHRPVFHFEAKRLRHSRSVAAYLGKDGVGCFVGERYARESSEAGMLGYVQSQSVKFWADAISAKIGSTCSGKLRLSKDGDWERLRMLSDQNVYRTVHDRQSLGRLTLFHTLLEFQDAADS